MGSGLSYHDIYDAVLDDELFASLPGRMAGEMDVPSALFFWLHPGDLQEITAGTQPETNPYYDEVMQQDPWMAQVNDDRIGVGAFRLTDFVSGAEFEKSVMYNEFIVRNRLDRFWCLGLVQDTRDGRVVTAFHKGRRAGDFTDEETRFVNRHVPDLGRLHSIRRELLRNDVRRIAAADNSLMDEVPIFELDHEGRLLRLNGMAESLLRLHPLLFLRHSRVLGLAGPERRALELAIGRATDAARAEAGRIELPPVRAEDGRLLPGLTLSTLPRSDGGRRVLVVVTTAQASGLRHAFEDPQDRVRLTARELDVLDGLMRGRRRDQLAHDLGVTVPTVDLHSANIRRKLGARTMPEAVVIALSTGVAFR